MLQTITKAEKGAKLLMFRSQTLSTCTAINFSIEELFLIKNWPGVLNWVECRKKQFWQHKHTKDSSQLIYWSYVLRPLFTCNMVIKNTAKYSGTKTAKNTVISLSSHHNCYVNLSHCSDGRYARSSAFTFADSREGNATCFFN